MTYREEFEAWLHEFDEAGLVRDCDIVITEWMQAAWRGSWQAATEQSQKEIAGLEAKLNELVKFQSSADRLAKAQAESLNTIAELKAREKVLVEAISISLNCIREEINLNNYTETLLGDFISDYGDMVTILQYALANVRGEVK